MTTDISEAKRIAQAFENEDQTYLPEGDDAKRQKLPKKPSPEQVESAFWQLRWDLSIALKDILEAIEDQSDEIAKLKGHRHDTTKAYSGRPEL
jgi:hypothetical protein